LAIAGKAGLAVAGFTKVEMALQRQTVVALLHAAEASPEGVKKLNSTRRRAAKHGEQEGMVETIHFLALAQLDLAFGRPNVVHAALLAGSASDTFLARLRRLERFRTGDPEIKVALVAPH
jgi:hypothetical protein